MKYLSTLRGKMQVCNFTAGGS